MHMQMLMLDDERHGLAAVESSLRKLGPTWQIAHASDSASARRALCGTPCNALIVATASAPRVALDVLTAARQLTPNAMRIAVVENEGQANLLVRADLVHRAVMQPVHADSLAASLRSMRALGKLLGCDVLRQRVERVRQLPQAPHIALNLLRESHRGNGNLRGVATRLHGDASLSAKILRLSNSSFYCRGKPIIEIERAVTRLGLDTVLNLALAVQAFAQPDLQRRAILASQLVGVLLKDAGDSWLAPVASTAATLAHVGKLLPLGAETLPAPRDNEEDDDFDDLRRTLPLDCVAGAYLLSRWGLPWPVIEAVAYHRDPMSSSEVGFGITSAVHVACALADGRDVDGEWMAFLGVDGFVDKWKADLAAIDAAMSTPAPTQAPPARRCAA